MSGSLTICHDKPSISACAVLCLCPFVFVSLAATDHRVATVVVTIAPVLSVSLDVGCRLL